MSSLAPSSWFSRSLTSVGADFGFVRGFSGSRVSCWPAEASPSRSFRCVDGFSGVSSAVAAVPVVLEKAASSEADFGTSVDPE